MSKIYIAIPFVLVSRIAVPANWIQRLFSKSEKVWKKVSREDKYFVHSTEGLVDLPDFALPKDTEIYFNEKSWPCLGRYVFFVEYVVFPQICFCMVHTSRNPDYRMEKTNQDIPYFEKCGWKVVDFLGDFSEK